MSNKAKNSKESILCDAKELMKLYDRVTWHLPKARREHSAVRRFEDAGYAIIHYCTIAMELRGEHEQQRKREYVEHLIGSFWRDAGGLRYPHGHEGYDPEEERC